MSAHKIALITPTPELKRDRALEDDNERLIEINAELLEALKNFSNCAMPNDPWSPEFLDGVHNLIAKAEGK